MPERVSILYQVPAGAEVQVLEIDATLSSQRSLAAEVTQVPVESGATISDHVLHRPDTLKLEGIISNTPLRANLSPSPSPKDFQQAAEAGAYAGRARAARDVLKAIKALGEPVIIQASETFENMVLQTLDIPEETATGDVLRFTAGFIQIRTVASQVVVLPKMASGKVSGGQKATSKAPAALAGRADSLVKFLVNPSRR